MVPAPSAHASTPTLSTFERISVPAVVITSVVAAVGVLTAVGQFLNERRDLILGIGAKPESHVGPVAASIILYHDWVPGSVMTLLFLLLMIVVVFAAPRFLPFHWKVPKEASNLWGIATVGGIWVLSLVILVVMTCLFAYGSFQDYALLRPCAG